MSDDSQIVVPPSFMALYVAPGKIKPDVSRQLLIERYEFCEDLAQVLLEQAKTKQWELGISRDIVMERIEKGLSQTPGLVSDLETQWVMKRLNELLDSA
jgi:hypothetical protein